MDQMVKAVRGVVYMELVVGREIVGVTLVVSPDGTRRGASLCVKR